MRVLVASALAALGAAACASVGSSVQVTGPTGRPTTRAVPVFYALAPPFAYREVGQIHATGQADQAHLDELIREAEARAGELGADAIVVREVRTDTRYSSQQVWRTCTTYGPGGRPAQYSCPETIATLSIESHLVAAAVRRVEGAAPRGSAPRASWPPPPPLPAPLPPGPAGRAAPPPADDDPQDDPP